MHISSKQLYLLVVYRVSTILGTTVQPEDGQHWRPKHVVVPNVVDTQYTANKCSCVLTIYTLIKLTLLTVCVPEFN